MAQLLMYGIKRSEWGKSENLWLKRPVAKSDILAVKTIVDAGRDALAAQLLELQKQKRLLLGE